MPFNKKGRWKYGIRRSSSGTRLKGALPVFYARAGVLFGPPLLREPAQAHTVVWSPRRPPPSPMKPR